MNIWIWWIWFFSKKNLDLFFICILRIFEYEIFFQGLKCDLFLFVYDEYLNMRFLPFKKIGPLFGWIWWIFEYEIIFLTIWIWDSPCILIEYLNMMNMILFKKKMDLFFVCIWRIFEYEIFFQTKKLDLCLIEYDEYLNMRLYSYLFVYEIALVFWLNIWIWWIWFFSKKKWTSFLFVYDEYLNMRIFSKLKNWTSV